MDQNKLLECIEFFSKLKVVEREVTTEEELKNNQKVVIVDYYFNDIKYTTNKLYYKNIFNQNAVKNPKNIAKYFGNDVFWLDIDVHDWAKGSGEAELEKIIIDEIAPENNPDFKVLLKKVANNNKSGFIQKITASGKPGQYHHNFENNNHWHDIINLVKEIINNKGKKIPKQFFSRLVFRWDGDKHTARERSSLAREVENKGRAFIDELYNNISSIQTQVLKMELTQILLNKKQIILQGPPGTGKTYTAKDIAYKLIFNEEISLNVDERKKQLKELENSEQFKLVQFHPSYSYEDFVRGITAKSNGTQIEYVTENKILAEFAETSLKNQLNSNKAPETISKEKWLNEYFDLFIDDISEEIDDKGKIILTTSVNIIKLDEDAFRYKGTVGWSENGNRMLFSDIKQAYLDENVVRQDVKRNFNLSGLARHHASYYIRVLDLFRKFLGDHKIIFTTNELITEELKKYVIIIDEINRANLPSVLGELIYALEYRGSEVNSMYEINGKKTIIIPDNLFVIGTMNTADRSVGHIDYAIRRRFAFVDILPNALVIENVNAKQLFEEISALFHSKETLASDFKAEQVQLGHSYFIVKDDGELYLKVKYEIVPILEEYLKDGILLEKAEAFIFDLKQRIED